MTNTSTAEQWAVRYHDDVEEISRVADEVTARTLAEDFNRATSGPAWAEAVQVVDGVWTAVQ